MLVVPHDACRNISAGKIELPGTERRQDRWEHLKSLKHEF